ncbi:MAG: DNA polymerase I [Acetobacteraceae bacterium]
MSEAAPLDAELAEADPPAATPADPLHLILIDGSGFIFRAFHALPPMTRADGTPVNAVFGFTNMLARLLQNHEGTHIAVVFDAGRTTFRNELYSQYKAQRPEPPAELVPQFALVRDATAAFGVPGVELATWEADDLIASYAVAASKLGGRTTIISSDKDLMQLIDDRVMMQDPIKQKPIGEAEVMAKFGVTPAKVVEVQALMGDSVDNVPGVPGVGPKNAAQLIQDYGDVEGVIAAIDGMKPGKRRDLLREHAENIRISRKLVELCREVPLPIPIEALRARDPDPSVLGSWLLAMGFRSTATRLGMTDGAAPTPEPATLDAPPEQPPFGPYACVTTIEALHAWIEEARRAGLVGLDTETDGLDPTRATLLGVSLAIGPGRSCYIPLRHRHPASLAQPDLDGAVPPALQQLDPATALSALAPLLGDPAVLKVMHNGKPDLIVLAREGVPTAPVDDTMLLSYAQGAGAHGHGLDELALRDLGHQPVSFDSVTGTGRARLPFAEVPLDRATAYAAEDPDIALRLWHIIRPRLRTAHALGLYEQVERRLLPVLIAMERAGVKVDADELRRMSADFAQRMEVMETEIHGMAGREFNLGSPKALGEILFDEMKLPGGRRMATGAWGTDVTVLQGLADQGHELPARIIDWRQLSKLRSTYTEALQQQINPATGRVHTSFGQAHTSTGRVSSTDPNLQNIPIRTEEGSRIRRAFVAEPGHVLVSCDYSQIELRLMAHVADIAPLKEAFATGQDIHARTAAEVFGVPIEGMDRVTRNRAKAINFGIIYGISGFGLARQLGIEPGEAALYIKAYFERYPGIRDYMERTKEEARIHGYVLTPFGRRCWVPGIREKAMQKRAYAERQAINAPLQGGAADIIKRAMVRLPKALAEAGLAARLLLQVHDELLFEAAEAEAERTAGIAKSVMEGAATLSVPLVVETGAGRSWAEAH